MDKDEIKKIVMDAIDQVQFSIRWKPATPAIAR